MIKNVFALTVVFVSSFVDFPGCSGTVIYEVGGSGGIGGASGTMGGGVAAAGGQAMGGKLNTGGNWHTGGWSDHCPAGYESCACYGTNLECNAGLVCTAQICTRPGMTGVQTTGGSAACSAGAERCECYGNGTCNSGLVCASNLCVRLGTGGSNGTGGATYIGNSSSGGTAGHGGVSTSGGATVFPSPACGDAVVQPSNGEQCDLGTAMNIGQYGGCTSVCTLGPYCGDGVTNGPEQCDFGTTLNTGDYGGCRSVCTLGPYCGDGVVEASFEECDDGTGNGSVSSLCSTSCKKSLVGP